MKKDKRWCIKFKNKTTQYIFEQFLNFESANSEKFINELFQKQPYINERPMCNDLVIDKKYFPYLKIAEKELHFGYNKATKEKSDVNFYLTEFYLTKKSAEIIRKKLKNPSNCKNCIYSSKRLLMGKCEESFKEDIIKKVDVSPPLC